MFICNDIFLSAGNFSNAYSQKIHTKTHKITQNGGGGGAWGGIYEVINECSQTTHLGNTPATMMPGSVGLGIGDQAILTNIHVPSKQGVLGFIVWAVKGGFFIF